MNTNNYTTLCIKLQAERSNNMEQWGGSYDYLEHEQITDAIQLVYPDTNDRERESILDHLLRDGVISQTEYNLI